MTFCVHTLGARAAAVAALVVVAAGLPAWIGNGSHETASEPSATMGNLSGDAVAMEPARPSPAPYFGDEYRDAEQKLLRLPTEPEFATF